MLLFNLFTLLTLVVGVVIAMPVRMDERTNVAMIDAPTGGSIAAFERGLPITSKLLAQRSSPIFWDPPFGVYGPGSDTSQRVTKSRDVHRDVLRDALKAFERGLPTRSVLLKQRDIPTTNPEGPGVHDHGPPGHFNPGGPGPRTLPISESREAFENGVSET